MDGYEILGILMGSLRTFVAFATLVVATVIVFVLWKRKEGGALGAFLLMLAQTGVWITAFGKTLLAILRREVDFEVELWAGVGLSVNLVLATLVMIIAFLLIKPKKAALTQEMPHG